MTRIKNPYLAIILLPLIVFLILTYYRVDADYLNLWSRAYAFIMLGYVGARYVGRAPMLMWEKNTSPEARNIVGWAIVVIGFMLQIAYGWIYIAYERPVWLSSQYWGSSFVVLMCVGLTIVASSIPRFPPFGDDRNGLGEVTSILAVIISSLAIFFAAHIPHAVALIKGLFASIAHVFP